MVFISLIWLGWIWLTVSLYWLSPRNLRRPLLIALTLIFLATISIASIGILCSFVLLCYYAAKEERPSGSTICVAISAIVAILVSFKISVALPATSFVESVVLPLGLSYYSFRCVHYLMERFRGTIGPASFGDLAGYLLFLPTLVVGPIHRYDDYIRDWRRQRFDTSMLSYGLERVLYGYVKILVLSNYLITGVVGGWIDELMASGYSPTSALIIYLNVVQNGINLYLQFSGHSDIAIGFSRLLGYRVIENFNWPYLKTNIGDFWRSWHISLSRWCREYIYGFVTAYTRLPAFGAMATMVTIGLWHEISFRFLIWGLYHAAGIIVWKNFSNLMTKYALPIPAPLSPPINVLKILVTCHFVWFGFVILTAVDLPGALMIYRNFFLGVLGV